MPKTTLETIQKELNGTKKELRGVGGQLRTEIRDLARKTSEEIQSLARMTADGFAAADKKFATKEELKLLRNDMQNGFALVMEELRPMRHDYQALKDDIAPEVENLKGRVTKVERKLATL